VDPLGDRIRELRPPCTARDRTSGRRHRKPPLLTPGMLHSAAGGHELNIVARVEWAPNQRRDIAPVVRLSMGTSMFVQSRELAAQTVIDLTLQAVGNDGIADHRCEDDGQCHRRRCRERQTRAKGEKAPPRPAHAERIPRCVWYG